MVAFVFLRTLARDFILCIVRCCALVAPREGLRLGPLEAYLVRVSCDGDCVDLFYVRGLVGICAHRLDFSALKPVLRRYGECGLVG